MADGKASRLASSAPVRSGTPNARMGGDAMGPARVVAAGCKASVEAKRRGEAEQVEVSAGACEVRLGLRDFVAVASRGGAVFRGGLAAYGGVTLRSRQV